MTEQHECVWGPWHPWCSTYRCIHPGCYKNMPSEEVAKRLNEYETLKRERDALMMSIKDTHFLQGKNECLRKSVGKDCQICEAYADILKDG